MLYVGTFSKILFPGLRIGWMAAARPVIRALTALRRASELCPAPLLQAALEDFLEKGHYDQHLARLHRQFRRRMEVALKSLRRELDPAQVKWEAPAGGYLIWLELVTEVSKTNLDAHFSTYGLKVLQGDRFYRDKAPGAFLRLSISSLDENQIETGIRRLGQAIKELPCRS